MDEKSRTGGFDQRFPNFLCLLICSYNGSGMANEVLLSVGKLEI